MQGWAFSSFRSRSVCGQPGGKEPAYYTLAVSTGPTAELVPSVLVPLAPWQRLKPGTPGTASAWCKGQPLTSALSPQPQQPESNPQMLSWLLGLGLIGTSSWSNANCIEQFPPLSTILSKCSSATVGTAFCERRAWSVKKGWASLEETVSKGQVC